MNIRLVRAVLNFNTPSGTLRKVVNWSYYESKALLTPSSTALSAYDKFFEYGKRIIGSSILELRYLDTISFFEEIRTESAILYKKKSRTDIIRIIRDGDEIVKFDVLP